MPEKEMALAADARALLSSAPGIWRPETNDNESHNVAQTAAMGCQALKIN